MFITTWPISNPYPFIYIRFDHWWWDFVVTECFLTNHLRTQILYTSAGNVSYDGVWELSSLVKHAVSQFIFGIEMSQILLKVLVEHLSVVKKCRLCSQVVKLLNSQAIWCDLPAEFRIVAMNLKWNAFLIVIFYHTLTYPSLLCIWLNGFPSNFNYWNAASWLVWMYGTCM